MVSSNLVLSIFPGIDILGMGFEQEGYCVVRGPDVLWGGDIRAFHPPSGVFAGVIGGPPCQEFSALRHFQPAAGKKTKGLITQFARVVGEATPAWFLMENVLEAPMPLVVGYQVQDLILDNRWLGGEQKRKRRISFGSVDGVGLCPEVAVFEHHSSCQAVTAGHGQKVANARHPSDHLSIQRMCELQGLPETFTDEMPFTAYGKRRVIGNGVPFLMACVVAKAVRQATTETSHGG